MFALTCSANQEQFSNVNVKLLCIVNINVMFKVSDLTVW